METAVNSFFKITLKVENIYGLFPVKFLGRKRENSALEVLFPPRVSNCFCKHCMELLTYEY